MTLKGKKVLVFGTGKSGIGAANLLFHQGADVLMFDGKTDADTERIRTSLEGEAQILLGDLSDEVVSTLDLAILSPGVPTDLPLVCRIRETGVKIWGEVELAYQVGAGRVLAVTGTNGKTTTTALLGHIMREAVPHVFVVGNIGIPYTSVAEEQSEDATTVAEISSFQLETIDTFHPCVSAILNITPDHLNRHHTMEEYIRVKERITANQTGEDVCVLNYEDNVLRAFGEQCRSQVLFFSSAHILDRGIWLDGDTIWMNTTDKKEQVIDVNDLKLIGRHNYENVMAAVLMAYSAGVSLDSIRASIVSFKAVEHRIEYVAEKNGVVYYNDSKGTNPDAAIKGIQAMRRSTLLIAGGYDKDADYHKWIRSFDGKVRYLVLIGQTKEKIAQAAKECGFTNIVLLEDLREAFDFCVSHAKDQDAVLLSPACASWGQFDNYEQRGEQFKEYVNAL